MSTCLKGRGDLWDLCGFLVTRGKPRFLLFVHYHLLLQPTLLSSLVERFTVTISNRYIFQIKHHWLNICYGKHSKHCNHGIVVVFWLTSGHRCRVSVTSFPSPVCVVHSFACLLIHTIVSFFVPPDDANTVSESREILDVSPSITTNVIGQKTDELDADMCERSCEELSTMFQELKGLRVVVSNLIDGLQKVVSRTSDKCGNLTDSLLHGVNQHNLDLCLF